MVKQHTTLSQLCTTVQLSHSYTKFLSHEKRNIKAHISCTQICMHIQFMQEILSHMQRRKDLHNFSSKNYAHSH